MHGKILKELGESMLRRTDTSKRLGRAGHDHLSQLLYGLKPYLKLSASKTSLRRRSGVALLSLSSLAIGGSWVWSQQRLPVPPPGQAPSSRAIGQAPGLESFAVQPRTPAELMEAISYLVRVGRNDQAVGLAKKLNDEEIDDETLLEIRTYFGSARLLQLQNTSDPQLRSLMTAFIGKVNKAAQTESINPDRIEKLIEALSASKEEQEVAREKLAKLGSFAVGPLVDSYDKADADTRKAIQKALNDLGTNALPGLFGAARHPKPEVVAAVAEALGHIGDPSALPGLAYLTTRPDPVGASAKASYSAMTGGKLPQDPGAMLKQQSAQYLDRDAYFTGNSVELWFWNTAENRLEPKTLDKSLAEGAVGYRLARLALDLNPADQEAQTLALSILLQEEIDRLGSKFPGEDPAGIWAIVKASGPQAVGRVLSRAVSTGKHEQVALLAIKALGEVMTAADLQTPDGKPGVLARAMHSMDRRVQFDAAKTLLKLAPEGFFPGSSGVVPALARFLQANPVAPRAVIVHNNLVEGSDWLSYLRTAGYDPILETSGKEGFAEAARRGDAELVLISTTIDPTSWGLHETISNFRADARTAGLPLIVVGPLDSRLRLQTLLNQHDRVGFIVNPANQDFSDRQIAFQLRQIGVAPLTPEERKGYAGEAFRILSEVASAPKKSGIKAMLASLDPHTLGSLFIDKKPEKAVKSVDRKALLQKIVSGKVADQATAAEELRADVQATGERLSADLARKLSELFLSLENNDAAANLRDSLGGLVGQGQPSAQDVGKLLLKFSPSADFYEPKNKSGKEE